MYFSISIGVLIIVGIICWDQYDKYKRRKFIKYLHSIDGKKLNHEEIHNIEMKCILYDLDLGTELLAYMKVDFNNLKVYTKIDNRLANLLNELRYSKH